MKTPDLPRTESIDAQPLAEARPPELQRAERLLKAWETPTGYALMGGKFRWDLQVHCIAEFS